MKNLILPLFLGLCATPAHAVSVSVEASARFEFFAQSFGPSGEVKTPSTGTEGGFFAQTFETRNTLNLFESLGDSDTIRLENTSATDRITFDWIVLRKVAVTVDIPPDTVVAPTEFEVTSFAGSSLTTSAFAAVVGSYECSASDLADPAISCDGVSGFDEAALVKFDSLTLGPGDVFEVSIETAPLIIVSTALTPVPVPGAGFLLLGGLAGLGVARKMRRA